MNLSIEAEKAKVNASAKKHYLWMLENQRNAGLSGADAIARAKADGIEIG